MPLKHFDPFSSQLKQLDPKVNPYVAMMVAGMEQGSLPVACGEMLKDFPGKWRQKIAAYYGRETPFEKLVVEIGSHKGHVLCRMAANHPDIAFVGIDITYKRVVGAAERARKLGLKNVFTLLANAKSIDQIFAPGEIDGTLIFFPDPWVKKKRQAKNRLVDEEFARKLAVSLGDEGFLWFKTDQEIYFNQGEGAFIAAGYVPQSTPCEVTRGEYTSVFEQRFSEQNLPTYGSKWLRSAAKPLTPDCQPGRH
jgi:tRNA (guanine-N7-)-methyltransferase